MQKKLIESIFLDHYDFEKRKRFSIEYAWKAVFRIVSVANELPEAYFIVVSDNYIVPAGLHVDATQEVLDIKAVNELIHERFMQFLRKGDDANFAKYFIVDDDDDAA